MEFHLLLDPPVAAFDCQALVALLIADIQAPHPGLECSGFGPRFSELVLKIR